VIRYIENGFKSYIAQAENGKLWGFIAVREGHPWHGVQHYDTDMAGLMWTSSAATLRAQTSPGLPRGVIGQGPDWLFGVEVDPGHIEEEELELVTREAIWSLSYMLRNKKPVKR